MSTPPKRPFSLSPAKRALLERALRERGSAPPSDRIQRRAGAGPVLLSHAQERLWFLDQLEPGRPIYNVHFAFRLEGELDAQALTRSLDEVVRRHESLRTTFLTTETGTVQVVHPSGLHALARVDLRSTSADGRQAELLRLATVEAHRPFDLGAGPLLRAVLYRHGEHEHVLLVVMHHIVTDGWSAGVFMRELSILYEAFRAGRPSPLPELSLQYADFAEWQRNWLDGEVMATQLAYWKKKLAGRLPDLDLPTDRPRPESPVHRGAGTALDIPHELSEGVRALCRREEVTPFMLLFAAFAAWLHRLTQQDDIVIGAPIANRNRVEVEDLIGFFVNTLVLRADCSGDPSFREFLRRIRETALEAFAHQDLPLETLVEALQPRRVPGRSPFFQVLFAFQSGPKVEEVTLPGLKAGPLSLATETSRLDLTFYAELTDDGLLVLVEYDTDLFDASTIDRLLGHWRTLLAGIVADPTRHLSELPMLTPDERRRALDRASTGPEEKDAGSVLTLFDREVERTPEAVALECGDERLTYHELALRSQAIADRLLALGAGTDTVVGISAHRSPELVAGILGILRAGAAYVPLDPDYPRERVAMMVAESGMRLALADERAAASLAGTGVTVVGLRGVAGAPATEPRERRARRDLSDSLAYVIFTSGSTGRPKGVAMTHRALRNLVAWQLRDAPGPAATLQFASPSFDVSFQEIFATLCSGGRLVLVSEEVRRDPAELLRFLAARSVERLFVPCVALQQLASAAETQASLPGLREIVSAGEALRITPQIAGFLARLPTCRLVNQYGPTESHVVSAFQLAGSPAEWPVLPPIGRPIDGARLYVLDRRLEPVPPGVAGELYIGGVALARGYLNRPDLTAERFLPDPHCAERGGRMYRTGDLARQRADGTLEFAGRSDDQVKVRGVRIEPGEVEVTLARHPQVRDVVVLAPVDAEGQRRLVAFVLARDGAAPAADELRRFARSALPDALVPSAFVALDAFPLTPSGKVDRRALLARCDAPAEPVADGLAPRTPTEELLAGIFAHVLRLQRVGVRDDFFELGGHSLLATQVVSRVRKTFRVELPLRALFENPTAARLAEHVERTAGRGEPALPIERTQRDAEAPLSFAQQRLWFLDQLQPGSAAYNLPVAMRLEGALDVDALRRALAEVVRRHEALRTTFVARDGEPVQVIAAAEPFELVAEEATEDGARALADEEARRPFDLARGPLFRARLVRVAEGGHVLLLTMHHAVSDGWSIGVLVRELSQLYAAFLAGKPSPLSELVIQYADFAAWQRRWLSGDVLERQLAYWKNTLAGAPAVLALATDRPRPRRRSDRGDSRALALPASLAASLRELGRREGTTLFMTLLAAFQALLARLSGETDVVVGTPIASRNRAEIEELIGFFVNTLALRVDLSGEPSFRLLLARVREAALGAFAHQDLPFERIVEALAPQRDLSRSPIFQVFFNLLDFGTDSLELPGLAARSVDGGEAVGSKFDLTLYAHDGPEGLHLQMVYARDLFDGPRIEEMLAQLGLLLARFAADPDERIGRHPLLTSSFRCVLPDPAEPLRARWLGSITERCAAHARHGPERVALSDRDGTWSRRELDDQSGRLAASLRAEGVGAGDVVAIFAHRDAALACALLGTWKAGAAFVVLDPAYPALRLAQCLALARPKAWLRVAGAGEVPPELAAAVRESVGGRVFEVSREERFGGIAPAPPVELGPDDVAYVAFTSGTTGAPRGIVGTHAPLAHFLDWHARSFELAAGDRFSVLAGLSHDPLLRDLFAPLWVGASAHFPGEDELETPGALARWVRASEITVAHLTPAMGGRLALEAEDGALPSLRLACFGGDRLDGRDTARVRRLAPRARCVNFYGATETPQAMSFSDAGAAEGPVPLGRGIEGVQLLVLDAAGGLAGLGETGDIHVRTPYLARGYLGDEVLTRQRFLLNPFTGREGDRVYATGDRGRFRLDGTVEFCGRLDAQVKIRGARIELGEIEGALEAHPAIRAAAVVAREEDGEQVLVAYVVPARESALAELRAFLRARLPDAMVPAAFVPLERLPLTPNGKLDRRALPAPPRPAEHGPGFVAPRTAGEEILAGLVAALLGRERVSMDADFFELGGHSLLATQLVSRVRRTFALELPLRTLFESPRIRALAERIAALAGAGPAAPPITPRPLDGDLPLPLSFAQQRLWFLDRLEPGSSAYNLPLALKIAGPLDVGALERVVSEVVRRHESLRSTFAVVDGEPRQVVADAARIALPVEEASEDVLEALVAEEARRPFDLERGPVFRARLLRLAATEHVLLLSLHHVAADGWSLGLLLRELALLYGAFEQGEPAPLPELAIQYADFARWQREWLAGERLERELAHWREVLAGAPAFLELPADHPRPALSSRRGDARGVTLSAELLERLRALGRREGATLFMTLLAGFQALLSRLSGETDLVVGTPIANRNRAEIEDLIGFFVNTLALRTDLAGDPPFRELLARVRETTLAAYAHQDLPFEKLVEVLAPARELARTPLFQVMFVLQNAPAFEADVSGLHLEPLDTGPGGALFDLTLVALESEAGLALSLRFATDLFEGATIERWLASLARVFAAIAADPALRLSRLPLLDEEARRTMLVEWNGTAPELPAGEPLAGLFERAVDRAPEATALVLEGASLSYGELDRRANRLAHRLVALGVGPEVRVALALERSFELIAALLAVLKAGGAYVPLDPGYPDERLSFMTADSGAAVVLTDSRLAPRLTGCRAQVLCLDREPLDGASAERLASRARPEQLAYVIYTSGSSGRPKGVAVTQGNVARLFAATRARFSLGPVGSSRVDLQACKLEYSIVSPK